MAGFGVEFPAANLGGTNTDASTNNDPVGAITPMAKGDEGNQRLLTTLNAWWIEARDAHAPNRAQQHKDADFYDHHQLTDEEIAVMNDRGQSPLVFNLVKPACDWVIGTERRTRVDWKVHPRGPEDVKGAQAKQETMKYVDDVNDGGYARSQAFSHMTKVGIGWTEECYEPGAEGEPLIVRHVDWKQMWWDPFATALDLRDARYMTRAKFLDVDYCIQQWPKFADAIERSARSTDEIDIEDAADPADVPGMFFARTSHSHDSSISGMSGFSGGRRFRSRVRVLQTIYKKPVRVKRMIGFAHELDRQVFDPKNAEHAKAVATGWVQLIDAINEELHSAIWLPNLILENKPLDNRHKRYPYTPMIAFRDDKSGMPYGLIRGMRDAQEDYNARRAKSLFLLSTNRVIYEEGAVEEKNEDAFRDEAAAPNAMLRVRNGALQNNRLRFENGTELAQSHVMLMENSKQHVFEGNGITRENLGQETRALSGKAILAKQQQGSVSTAELFDNYRYSFRQSGKKTLSNIEQYMSLPKRIRIIGAKGMEWLMVNEPVVDPMTGEVFFENDLTKSEADFYVDQQDYRETVRMAMAETLFEVIAKLPPELQLGMLDLAVELTDLPNRDEIVRRIRALNGHGAPGDENSPEAMAAAQAKAAQQQREQQLIEDERSAKVRRDNAAALRDETTARKTNVDTKAAALNTAAVLESALPLAPAADRLTEFPAQAGAIT